MGQRKITINLKPCGCYSVIAGAVFGFWLWFGALEVGALRLQHQCHAKLYSVSHNAVFFDVFSQLHYKLWM
jgi:hypothetical protein